MNLQLKLNPSQHLKTYLFLRNYMTSLGFLAFAFGIIFSMADNSYLDISSIKINSSKLENTNGIIKDFFTVSETFKGEFVVVYHYEMYHPTLGITTGKSFAKNVFLNKGDQVEIEYVKETPLINRIKGMSNSYVSEFSIISGVVCLVGFIFLFIGVRKTNRFMNEINNSFVTTAKLIKKPSTKLMEGTRYFICDFEFITKEGNIINIHKEITNALNVLDDENEFIIYDKRNPNINYFVDRLPTKLKVYIYNELNLENIEQKKAIYKDGF